MTWALEDIVGADKLVEYERALDTMVTGKKMRIVCLYDQSRFGQEMVKLMERIHQKTLSK